MLASDRTGLFGSAVARITHGLPVAGPLLLALALAQGRGLPRADGIWAHAASGVAGSERPPADEELSLFLARAAAYVLLDGENRRSVYRLAHRTYTEQLLATCTIEERLGLLTALLDLAARQCSGGQSISPHLESRLAEYAADCGAAGWAELAGRPAVLDRLPVAGLSVLALTPGGDGVTTPADLPIEVLGTVASAHLIQSSAPTDRPGLRQLGGLRATGRLHPAGPGAAWEVCWGRLRTLPPHLKLAGADGAVSALTAHATSPWLVTGTLDGNLGVWEPWRTHRPVLLLRNSDRPVSALAALGDRTDDEGPGLLLAAHDDRTLHLWDTGREHQPTRPTVTTAGEVVRVMAVLPDGTRRFALGGDGGYLALLGADGRHAKVMPVVASGDVVGLTPLASAEGRQWLAAAHRSGELVLWDVSGPEPARLAVLQTRRMLTALAAVADADGARRLVTAAYEGPVEFWRVTRSDGRILLLAATDREAQDVAGSQAPPADRAARRERRRAGGQRRRRRPAAAAPGRRATGTGGRRHPAGQGYGRSARAARRDRAGNGGRAGSAGSSVGARARRQCGPGHAVGPRHPGAAAQHGGRHGGLGGPRVRRPAAAISPGPAVRILRAADGQDLTGRVPPDSLPADAPPDGAGCPSSVDEWHTSRVMDWTALEGGPGGALWASLDRDGVVLVWRHEPSGSDQPVHRIRLGAPGLRLTALRGGRLAVTTDDGIVVLAIGAVASGATTRGRRTRMLDDLGPEEITDVLEKLFTGNKAVHAPRARSRTRLPDPTRRSSRAG